jgi:hypothetical protein
MFVSSHRQFVWVGARIVKKRAAAKQLMYETPEETMLLERALAPRARRPQYCVRRSGCKKGARRLMGLWAANGRDVTHRLVFRPRVISHFAIDAIPQGENSAHSTLVKVNSLLAMAK